MGEKPCEFMQARKPGMMQCVALFKEGTDPAEKDHNLKEEPVHT
jgi:hypothetical protein